MVNLSSRNFVHALARAFLIAVTSTASVQAFADPAQTQSDVGIQALYSSYLNAPGMAVSVGARFHPQLDASDNSTNTDTFEIAGTLGVAGSFSYMGSTAPTVPLGTAGFSYAQIGDCNPDQSAGFVFGSTRMLDLSPNLLDINVPAGVRFKLGNGYIDVQGLLGGIRDYAVPLTAGEIGARFGLRQDIGKLATLSLDLKTALTWLGGNGSSTMSQDGTGILLDSHGTLRFHLPHKMYVDLLGAVTSHLTKIGTYDVTGSYEPYQITSTGSYDSKSADFTAGVGIGGEFK